MHRLMMISLMLLLISSCKYLPPTEICKYRYETDLCLCKFKDHLTGRTVSEVTKHDPEYCFKGVIISENSYPILSSYLRKAGKKVHKRHRH